MAQITEDEAYRKILAILSENDLDWVSFQVQEQVRAGKPITKRVRVEPSYESIEEGSAGGRSRSEQLAGSEPYSAGERFLIALHALDAAIVQTAEMESAVLGYFKGVLQGQDTKKSEEVPAIEFVPGEFEETEPREILPLDVERKTRIENLKKLINDIQESVEL